MSTTALVWIIVYTAGTFLSFVHPAYGLYAYFLDYYAHPPLRWWGKDLPQLRWSLIIAVVTLAAFVVNRHRLPELKIKSHPQTRWLVWLLLMTLIVTPFAVWWDKHLENVIELAKMAALYFLVIQTIRTKEHFRYLILIQILGIFYWGWNAFDDPKRLGGRLVGIGGPDSLGDNGAAAHMLAIMPFIGVLFLTGRWWEKAIGVVAAPFVLNAFILCNSRGAFVALVLTGIVAVLIANSGLWWKNSDLRWKMLLGVGMGAILFYNLMDPQFITRQKTIQTYEEDTSATGRIEAWKGALKLIKDHPFGTGGGGFDALSPVYIPEIVAAEGGQYRAVHNTYLQVASEWGIPGLIFFMGFIVSTLLELNAIRRTAPATPQGQRIQMESIGITLGFLGILIAGIFVNRAYAETIYWLPAFAAALANIQAQTMEAESVKREASMPDADRFSSLAAREVSRDICSKDEYIG